MAAPASTLGQLHRPLSRSQASPREAPKVTGTYRFQVMAAGIADAVMSIGGLIFDRAMAGWDVSVVVDGEPDRGVDHRPIKILGARVVTRSPDADDDRPNLLAVATDLMIRSDAVRRRVLEVGKGGETAVLLWGRHHPTTFGRTFVAARHQPSAAAQVFKYQALMAGGMQASQRADEGFYSMA